MRKEDKLYIESYLCKVVALCAEVSYRIDKFGNIVFKDKNKVIENINKLISNSTKELEASESEIRDYLIHVYKEKSINPEFAREGTELISILEETKQDKDKTENKVNNEQNKEEVR